MTFTESQLVTLMDALNRMATDSYEMAITFGGKVKRFDEIKELYYMIEEELERIQGKRITEDKETK